MAKKAKSAFFGHFLFYLNDQGALLLLLIFFKRAQHRPNDAT
jgi:hypothetical protein